ncbi:MAG TPA: AAA family ATPase, partial [Spirochaetia bacterium]|nr:AAA family ATPase [Spirochaetia bacterium]
MPDGRTFLTETGEVKPVKDVNDAIAAAQQQGIDFVEDTNERLRLAKLERPPNWSSVRDLAGQYERKQRRPVIEGLLRKGEVMTVVAPPKAGKSWLGYNLAYSVASGSYFLREDWKCWTGRVAILDNELHAETLGYRLPHMGDCMGKSEDMWDNIWVRRYRGEWKDLHQIKDDLILLRAWKPSVVILDSLYRFYGEGMDENSNADMAQICNTVDMYARMLDAAIILIHHNAKGLQANKSITDVGAGGGALVRGVDSHMILREHEDENHFVLEAAARTWAKPEKYVLEWEFPLFREVTDKDPAKLKGATPERTTSKCSVADLVGNAEALTLVLDDEWVSNKTLQQRLQERHGCSAGVAGAFLSKVKAQYRLNEIDEIEDEKC